MTPPTSQPTPPLIRDWRNPGQPMTSIPVKLPPDLVEGLMHRAQLLGCSRAALARDLIARGLADLETAAAAWGESGALADELEPEAAQGVA